MQNANQPQVRSGSLPTNNPAVQPRTAQRAAPAQAAQAQEEQGGGEEQMDNAASPEGGKPKRKAYKRKVTKLNDGSELSAAELATLGRITIKASQAGITPAKYIDNLKKNLGSDEIDVWDKVSSTAPEQTVED
jgi:hypothetical protein